MLNGLHGRYATFAAGGAVLLLSLTAALLVSLHHEAAAAALTPAITLFIGLFGGAVGISPYPGDPRLSAPLHRSDVTAEEPHTGEPLP